MENKRVYFIDSIDDDERFDSIPVRTSIESRKEFMRTVFEVAAEMTLVDSSSKDGDVLVLTPPLETVFKELESRGLVERIKLPKVTIPLPCIIKENESLGENQLEFVKYLEDSRARKVAVSSIQGFIRKLLDELGVSDESEEDSR